jgi:putative transposase
MKHSKKSKDPNKVQRRYRIRLYPTDEQEKMFFKHIHTCRFIWNYMLTIQKEQYELYKRIYSCSATCRILTELKQREEYSWLNEVSRQSLAIILNDLDTAYDRYFKGIDEGSPKFKIKKRSKKSFPVRYDQVFFDDSYAYIEKIGMVKFKSSVQVPEGKGQVRDTRIFLSKNGKWILSVSMECDKQTPKESLYGNMGIDMGIRKLATFSYVCMSDYIPNINKSRRIRCLRSKLKHLQRKVSRIYYIHGNYHKSKHIKRLIYQIRRIYHRIHNIVQDYNHKQTRMLVNLHPRKVIMEDLEITKITKRMPRWLRREIYYASWYDFRCKMEYKCNELGIKFVLADKSFPSTQMCSECGKIKTGKHKLALHDHVYVCKKCGVRLDRDVNAARNLEWYDNYLS